jgi:hypothetical protein
MFVYMVTAVLDKTVCEHLLAWSYLSVWT